MAETMLPNRLIVPVLALLFGGVLIGRGDAAVIVSSNHVTDGAFGTNEWNGPNVVKDSFPVVGNSGGAFLYVDQGAGFQAGTLYLLYDYVNSPNAGFGNASTSFFDVFFQVKSDNTDYVAQFGSDGNVSLFEKPTGTVSPENPDGTLNLSGPPWTADANTDADFVRGHFAGAIGFGTSENSSSNHLIAEFELRIDTSQFPGGPPNGGLYDPSPAFWSASAGPVGIAALDPPITSGIFQLNPDGTTIVTPVLGPNGGPVLQPQDAAVPEPSSLALLGIGAAMLFTYCRRR
jgi:hypothetical protein